MNARMLLAALVLASPAALAGPYDQPWSLVETGDASEVRKEAKVAITAIDGKSTRNPRKSDPIAPGSHKVTVRFETARAVVAESTREIDLNLEPCVRYRVVAKYESKTGPKWEPKVNPEPIGECAAKFKKGKAGN